VRCCRCGCYATLRLNAPLHGPYLAGVEAEG
jgi:hypothetical protein